MASRPRNVWSVLFGETIMTWPRIFGQQLLVLTLVASAVSARSAWFRCLTITVAVVTQGWIAYDASRRVLATHRARRVPAGTSARHPDADLKD